MPGSARSIAATARRDAHPLGHLCPVRPSRARASVRARFPAARALTTLDCRPGRERTPRRRTVCRRTRRQSNTPRVPRQPTASSGTSAAGRDGFRYWSGLLASLQTADGSAVPGSSTAKMKQISPWYAGRWVRREALGSPGALGSLGVAGRSWSGPPGAAGGPAPARSRPWRSGARPPPRQPLAGRPGPGRLPRSPAARPGRDISGLPSGPGRHPCGPADAAGASQPACGFGDPRY